MVPSVPQAEGQNGSEEEEYDHMAKMHVPLVCLGLLAVAAQE